MQNTGCIKYKYLCNILARLLPSGQHLCLAYAFLIKWGVFATHTMNHRKLAENKRSQTDMKIVDWSNKIASY